MSDAKYWNERGKNFYKYRGESFYTITPVPLYYRRRKVLLHLLANELCGCKTVLDYGCGDGFYLDYFSRRFPDTKFVGTDISEEMLNVARNKFTSVYVRRISEILGDTMLYDLVYVCMVLAHNNDAAIVEILSNIYSLLNENGKLVIFEQTAPSEMRGMGWTRRTMSRYEELAKHSGFSFAGGFFVSFPAHQWFERKIAPTYRKLFVEGESDTEKRINANKQVVFRLLSGAFASLTFNPVCQADKLNISAGGGVWLYFFNSSKGHCLVLCMMVCRAIPHVQFLLRFFNKENSERSYGGTSH